MWFFHSVFKKKNLFFLLTWWCASNVRQAIASVSMFIECYTLESICLLLHSDLFPLRFHLKMELFACDTFDVDNGISFFVFLSQNAVSCTLPLGFEIKWTNHKFFSCFFCGSFSRNLNSWLLCLRYNVNSGISIKCVCLFLYLDVFVHFTIWFHLKYWKTRKKEKQNDDMYFNIMKKSK